MRHVVLAALTGALLLSTVGAEDRLVPQEYASIGAALVGVSPGDRVLVSPGVYEEFLRLDYRHRFVEIIGVGGPEVTIVEAPFHHDPPPALVDAHVGFNPGGSTEALTVTVEGFTFRNYDGHGVAVGGSDVNSTSAECELVMRRCVLEGFSGSGLRIEAADTRACLEDCVVTGDGDSGLLGPGIRIERSLIASNVGVTGGGASNAELTDCVLRDNTAQFGGGAAESTLSGCVVEGNVAQDGGGTWLSFMSDTVVRTNSAQTHGAATVFGVGTYLLESVSFVGNQTAVGPDVLLQADSLTIGSLLIPGGVVLDGSVIVEDDVVVELDEATLDGCTILDSGIDVTGESVLVDHSILRGGAFSTTVDTLTVRYSNIQGGAPGVGNFDAEPGLLLTSEGLYQLTVDSACVDAGDPLEPDVDGSPRDVGAFPFEPFVDTGRGLPDFGVAPSLAASGDTAPGSPVTFVLAGGPPDGIAFLVASLAPAFAPFKGGVLVPDPASGSIGSFPLDASGGVSAPTTWPSGVSPVVVFWLQVWFPDTALPAGFSATNGLAMLAR